MQFSWFHRCTFFLLVVAALQSPLTGAAQDNASNTTEEKVPPYTLPDPLMGHDGQKITTAAQWNELQRPYIYHLFEENVYGRYPKKIVPIKFVLRETDRHALNGLAIRKQARIYLLPPDTSVYLDLLIYLPAAASGPVPVFAGYNFAGNQSIMPDDGIFLTKSWIASGAKGVINHEATDSARGTGASQW